MEVLRRRVDEFVAQQQAAKVYQRQSDSDLRMLHAGLKEYCEGRLGYFDALVADCIHEFRVNRGDINLRIDGIQALIDQYELASGEPHEDAPSDDCLSSSDDLLDRMLAVENKMLTLRERVERLDHRFEVVYEGVEAEMNRQGVTDKIMRAQISEVRDMGTQIVSYLDERNMDSVTEAITALQVRSDRINDAHVGSSR